MEFCLDRERSALVKISPANRAEFSTARPSDGGRSQEARNVRISLLSEIDYLRDNFNIPDFMFWTIHPRRRSVGRWVDHDSAPIERLIKQPANQGVHVVHALGT